MYILLSNGFSLCHLRTCFQFVTPSFKALLLNRSGRYTEVGFALCFYLYSGNMVSVQSLVKAAAAFCFTVEALLV